MTQSDIPTVTGRMATGQTAADHAVLIAGGGPTGMTLAAELALAGVDVAIVERRIDATLAGTRARGLHARTLELLDQRGIADRFVAEGRRYPVVSFHGPLDISDFPTRRNYVLAISQNRIEQLLAGWIDELGVRIYRDCEVTRAAQDDAGATLTLADGRTLRGAYLVGCDGGRSVVRRSAGIDFPGCDPTMSWLIAEVRMRDTPPLGFHTDARGIHAIGPAGDTGAFGVVLVEQAIRASGGRSLDDLAHGLREVYGTDFGAHDSTWISSSPTQPGRRRPIAPAGFCWRATPHTSIRRSAARASTSAFRMRLIWAGSLPCRSRASRPRRFWTATTPSGIRSARGC